MKLKLAIIFGVLIWILTNFITSLFNPIFNNNLPYVNILLPIIPIIITAFFGTVYIRNIYENEVVEGIFLGIIFIIVYAILDSISFILPHARLFIPNYHFHITSMAIITLLTTTFLGYLAQMKIDLK